MRSILPANILALVDHWRGRGGPLADPSIVGTFYGTRYHDGRWPPNERGISLHVMDERRVPGSARLLSLDLLGLDQDRRISSLRTVRELIRLLPSFLDGQIVGAAVHCAPGLDPIRRCRAPLPVSDGCVDVQVVLAAAAGRLAGRDAAGCYIDSLDMVVIKIPAPSNQPQS